MVSRNTIVGIDFLVLGLALAGLGYILAQSIPIAAIGVDVAILGALILLIVPEPIPQDAYKALLKDSISNIELMLEEAHLEEKAYFLPSEQQAGQVRAFVPALSVQKANPLIRTSNLKLVQSFSELPQRFVTNYGGQLGLLLIPPGNEIVQLSKIHEGDDLEEALQSALVTYSDLASSIIATQWEQDDGSKTVVKINIKNPKIDSELPFFNSCLGSPLSCIASCVVAVAKGKAVRVADEQRERGLIHTTVHVLH